jgi:nucleoside-diphosphate-sugar epimerase
MKVWILGFGWLGQYILNAFRSDASAIAAVSRNEEKVHALKELGLTPIIVSPAKYFIPDTIPFIPDVVICTIPPSKNPDDYALWCTYFLAMISSFEVAGANPQWIYTSSTGIYPDTDGRFDEAFPVTAQSARQMYLVMHEKVIQSQANGNACIVRLGGLLGEGRDAIKFYHHQAERFHASEPVNMIHGSDAAAFILHAVKNQLKGIFNVCSPQHPARQAFYQKACHDKGLTPNRMKEEGGFKNRIIDCNKMLDAGFTPSYKLV